MTLQCCYELKIPVYTLKDIISLCSVEFICIAFNTPMIVTAIRLPIEKLFKKFWVIIFWSIKLLFAFKIRTFNEIIVIEYDIEQNSLKSKYPNNPLYMQYVGHFLMNSTKFIIRQTSSECGT